MNRNQGAANQVFVDIVREELSRPGFGKTYSSATGIGEHRASRDRTAPSDDRRVDRPVQSAAP